MNFTKISATKNNSADIPIIFYNVHERTRVIILRKHFFLRDGREYYGSGLVFRKHASFSPARQISLFCEGRGVEKPFES